MGRLNCEEKDGFIKITEEALSELNKMGMCKLVAKNKEGYVGKKANIYIQYNNTNYVLMHVKYNYYKIINYMITTKNGKKINLPVYLAKNCSFSINGSSAACRVRKKFKVYNTHMYLHRVIESLVMYNTIANLDSEYDIHHVVLKMLETIYSLRYMPRKEHIEGHETVGKKSRKRVVVLTTADEVIKFMEKYIKEDQVSKNKIF